MKKFIKYIAALTIVITSMNLIEANAISAGITDLNFRSCLNTNYLNQDATTDITLEQIATITGKVECDNMEIKDVSGATYLTGVTSISLNGNSITNLDPVLKMSSVKHVYANDNLIADLSALNDSKYISILEVNNNNIVDVTAVGNSKTLTRFYANNNNISDVSALANNTSLTSVHLEENNISDITNVFSNNEYLSRLYLGDNPSLTDISTLAGLQHLTSLGIGTDSDYQGTNGPSTNISDISVVSQLPMLAHFNIIGTPIADLSPLANNTTLRQLRANDSNVSDLSPLANISTLTSLIVSGTSVSDLSPLANLQLEHLDVENTDVSDLSPLAKMTNMRGLLISHTNVTDLEALSNYVELRDFRAESLGIDSNDIEFLGNNPELYLLYLSSNSIYDISSLNGLSNMKWLLLNNQEVKLEDMVTTNPHTMLPREILEYPKNHEGNDIEVTDGLILPLEMGSTGTGYITWNEEVTIGHVTTSFDGEARAFVKRLPMYYLEAIDVTIPYSVAQNYTFEQLINDSELKGLMTMTDEVNPDILNEAFVVDDMLTLVNNSEGGETIPLIVVTRYEGLKRGIEINVTVGVEFGFPELPPLPEIIDEAPLLGVSPVVIEVGDVYTTDLHNASAIDDRDGDISSQVIFSGIENVNTTEAGIYYLDLAVTDSAGNETTASTYVLVNDGSYYVADGLIIKAKDFSIYRNQVPKTNYDRQQLIFNPELGDLKIYDASTGEELDSNNYPIGEKLYIYVEGVNPLDPKPEYGFEVVEDSYLTNIAVKNEVVRSTSRANIVPGVIPGFTTVQINITILDGQAPVLDVETPVEIYVGEEFDVTNYFTVTDLEDDAAGIPVDVQFSKVVTDTSVAATHEITITATDNDGNSVSETLVLIVKDVDTATELPDVDGLTPEIEVIAPEVVEPEAVTPELPKTGTTQAGLSVVLLLVAIVGIRKYLVK